MGKITTTIRVEEQQWLEFKKRNPGRASELIRKHITASLAIQKGQNEELDLLELKETLSSKTEQATKLSREIESLQSQALSIEEGIKEKEKKALSDEREKADSLRRCVTCSCVVGPKSKVYEINSRVFCRECFLAGETR